MVLFIKCLVNSNSPMSTYYLFFTDGDTEALGCSVTCHLARKQKKQPESKCISEDVYGSMS